MFKYLTLVIFLIVVSCGKNKSKIDPLNSFQRIEKRNKFYLKNVDWKKVFKHRCDKWTFYNLAAAYGGPKDIYKFEWSPGEWHRDINGRPCYKNGEDLGAKSETTADGFLTLVQALYYMNDKRSKKALNDLINYGEQHNWSMGEGPIGITNISHFKHIFYSLKNRFQIGLAAGGDIPKGFRGHLILFYIWNKYLTEGYINDLEKRALNYLVDGNPNNPLYQCMWHKFTDGNQSHTIFLMENNKNFPDYQIPYETGLYGWGSVPAIIYHMAVLVCLKGD